LERRNGWGEGRGGVGVEGIIGVGVGGGINNKNIDYL
jgi:hypothetical protein